MVKHNNVIPFQHFHKKWARRVKTWLNQPVQKKIRRDKRRLRAAKLAPRPSSGPLRPVVHCPTQKYNSKTKFGRGFTLEELKAANINRSFAQTIGIAVDHRRTNKSNESLQLNVQRLKEYKERLIVFPRRRGTIVAGEATKEQIASARQLKGDIIPAAHAQPAVTFTKLTEEMTSFKAYSALRTARTDAKLVGIRMKKAKEAKPEAKDAKDSKDE